MAKVSLLPDASALLGDEQIPLVQGSALVNTTVAAIVAKANERLSPFQNPGDINAALKRLIVVELYLKDANGSSINWPANLSVRELAADNSNRFRFRIGGGDSVGGDGNYPQIAAESANAAAAGATTGGDLQRAYAGLTSNDNLPLYASDTSLGVAKGTVVGTYRIAFDGTTFGTYFPFVVFDAEDGALQRSSALPSTAFDRNIKSLAKDIVEADAAIGDPFKLCADRYAAEIFRDGRIAGLDPDDTPWLNYETIFFAGTPLYRIRVFLHSTKIGGGAVARWSFQSETEPESLPETIHLTMKVQGSTNTGTDTNGDDLQEKGVTAIFKPDWSKIEWTKAATTYTTAAGCAVGQRAIITADELERRWLAFNAMPKRRVTVGSGWEYSTLVAAVQAYEDVAGTKTRSFYPISNLIAPEWPAQFEIMDADHEEEIGNFQESSIWQSQLRAPHGSVFVLRSDTRLYKAAAASGNTSPVIESSNTALWLLNGALIENADDAGYVFHIDESNGKSGRNGGGPMRRRLQSIVHGGRLKTASGTAESFLIGGGISDGQTMLFEDLVFERAGTGLVDVAMAVIHGSPNSTDPGTAIFRNCRTIGEGANKGLVEVIKSTAGAHRHRLIVENCVTRNGVTYANTTDPDDELEGWVAVGDFSGLKIPTALLDGQTYSTRRGAPITISGTTHTLAALDGYSTRRFTSDSPITLTVPANADEPFPIGAVVPISQAGAGQITVVGDTGVTVQPSGSLVLADSQYARAVLEKVAVNTWELTAAAESLTEATFVLPQIDYPDPFTGVERPLGVSEVSLDFIPVAGTWLDDAGGEFILGAEDTGPAVDLAEQFVALPLATIEGRPAYGSTVSINFVPLDWVFTDGGTTSSSGYTMDEIIVVESGFSGSNNEAFTVYQKAGVSSPSLYFGHLYKRQYSIALNLNIWRWQGTRLYTRAGTFSFSAGDLVVQPGNQEIAVRVSGDDDFSGGVHGNQYMPDGDPDFYVDGVPITHTGAGQYRCASFEVLGLYSIIQRHNTQDGTTLGSGTSTIDLWQRFRFERNTLLLLQNATSLSTLTYQFFYGAMLTGDRSLSSPFMFNTGYRAPKFLPEDIEDGVGKTFTTADTLIMAGDQNVKINIEMLKGWDDVARRAFFEENAIDQIKAYFDLAGNTSFASGTTRTWAARYTFDLGA